MLQSKLISVPVSLFCCVLLSVAAAGCGRAPDDAPMSEESKQGPESVVEAERPPLDLSLPPDTFADESASDTDLGKGDFDAKPLFDKKDRNVDVKVQPEFAEGEEPDELPKLDGGSVSVDVKTK